MNIRIVKDKISKDELQKAATESFGDMVKIVVDIEKKIMAVGGELHADAGAVLFENGSSQENLWGANIYPQMSGDDMIQYTSLINIRPKIGNRSMEIQDPGVRDKVKEVILALINP